MICHYVLINLPMFFSLQMTPVFLVTEKNHCALKHKVADTLSLIVNWFIANKLVLNINKTNIINFAPKQSANSLLAVSFGNGVMNDVPVITFLGIQIDNKLNWKSHVEYILPKLSSSIFVIRSLSYFMNLKTLRMAMTYTIELKS
jgi:hypothetical protein